MIDAKIALSAADKRHHRSHAACGDKRYAREITREQFEALIAPVIERTAQPCRQAIKDAGIAPEQIDEVVLVGGSTRIPRVQQLVDGNFRSDRARQAAAHGVESR